MTTSSKHLRTFFILAFAISWIGFGILHATALASGLDGFSELSDLAENSFALNTVAEQLVMPTWLAYLLSRMVDFGPTLAALAMVLWIDKDSRPALMSKLKTFNLTGMVWGLLLATGVVAVALILYALLGADPYQVNWQGLATVGRFLFWVIVARTLLGGGLGEEVGWRGYALPPMLDQHGPLKASFILGLIWAAWHLPLAFIAKEPIVQVLVLFAYVVPLNFVFTWIYLKFPDSVWPAILLHGALNGVSAFVERDFIPALLEDDTWVIVYILTMLLSGVVCGLALRKQAKAAE